MKKLIILLLALGFEFAAMATPTALSVVTLSETAAAFADNSADGTNGNSVPNVNCDVVLLLRNTHASNSSTVTIVAQGTTVNFPGFGPMTKANDVIVTAALTNQYVGPFPCFWNDTSGNLQITYTGTGTVKVSPIRWAGR